MELITLQVEHVAVEFIVELALVFKLLRQPPSDAVLTPAISPIIGDLWRVEHLISSHTGPKDLPTYPYII